MRLVERMTQHPPLCLHCGGGNTADDVGHVPRAIDLEREVNWGDSTYLCENCGALIAGLLEYISPAEAQDLRTAIAARDTEVHNLRAELQAQKRRSDQILLGRAALTEEKRARESRA